MNKLITHHLGMGDMIVHNGLVRYIYNRDKSKYDNIYLLCYEHYADNVLRMYSDIDLKLLTVKNYNEVYDKVKNFGGEQEDFHLNDEQIRQYFLNDGDDIFYTSKGYDKSLRKKFYIFRDIKKENEVYKNIVGNLDKYIFVHDDIERGFKITQHHNDLPVIRIPKDIPIFDTLKILECANECHVISSAFVCLLQSMPSLNKNVYVHTTVRNKDLETYFKRDGLKTI